MPAPARSVQTPELRPTDRGLVAVAMSDQLLIAGRKEGQAGPREPSSLSLPRDYSVPTENNNFVRYVVGPAAPHPSIEPPPLFIA